jgi:hypothetical protein
MAIVVLAELRLCRDDDARRYRTTDTLAFFNVLTAL